MMPESIAIVCAPTKQPRYVIQLPLGFVQDTDSDIAGVVSASLIPRANKPF